MSGTNPPPDQPFDPASGANEPPAPPPPPPAGPPAGQQPPPAGPPTGYPPPPPPEYPSYPPPPAGGGPYDQGGASRPSVGAAFNWGWKKFTENLGVILIAALLYWAIVGVLNGVGYLMASGIDSLAGASLVRTIFSILSFVVGAFLQAGIARGAAQITRGIKPELGTMFTSDQLGQVLLAGLLIGIGVSIGLILCIIPGLLVLFYTQFSTFFIVDKHRSAIDAIKASASLINGHVGTMVGFFFASLLAYIVGAILCLIGLLVAIPVVILAQAYMYRTLQGEAVAQ